MRRMIVALAIAAACVGLHGTPAGADGFESDTDTVQVVSANVGGKNVFIPATIAVTEDTPATLSIFNATDTPHGFKIDAAGVEAILQPGVETTVELKGMKSGIYPIHCHLHPPHRGGQLLVLDDD